jgi:biopolymer transport protein ExbD
MSANHFPISTINDEVIDVSDVVDVNGDDDQPIQLPRRPKQEVDMDITPMIDIVFLLLIFFLVASRIDADIQVSLPPARHGTAVATKNAVILTVAQGTGDQAEIYKGDGADPAGKLASTDPADQEAEIVDYVQAAMNDGKENVLVKAEKNVKHREVSRVAKAIGLVEGARLFVAVKEEE